MARSSENIYIVHALIKSAKHPTLTLDVNNFNLDLMFYFWTFKMERITKMKDNTIQHNFESLNGAVDSQFLQRFVCALQQKLLTDLLSTEGSCMLTKIDLPH